MMTVPRQQAGKMRKGYSNPGIGKGGLSTPKRPDRPYGPLSHLSRGAGRYPVAVKRPGSDAVYCPV